MLKPCIICFRLIVSSSTATGNDDPEGFTTEWRTFRKFLKLLPRYLQPTGRSVWDEQTVLQKFEGLIINAGLLPCEECSTAMESFCELYHQMESIRLVLDWKVWNLKNIMKSSEKLLPSGWKSFQEYAKQLEIEDFGDINFLIDSKRDLVKRCEQKLRRTWPRLKLNRFQQQQTNVPVATHYLLLPPVPDVNEKESDICLTIKSDPERTFENEEDHHDLNLSDDQLQNPSPEVNNWEEMELLPSDPMISIKWETPRSATPANPDDDDCSSDPGWELQSENESSASDSSSSEMDRDEGHSKQSARPSKRLPTVQSSSTTSTTASPEELLQEVPPRSSFNPKTRKHKCLLCQAEFTQRYVYIRHHRDVHLSIKAFDCKVCNASFKRKYHLTRHLSRAICAPPPGPEEDDDEEEDQAVPLEETSKVKGGGVGKSQYIFNPETSQYKCSICPEEEFFSSRRDWQVHFNSSHKMKVTCWECPKCKKTLANTASLRAHRRRYKRCQLKVSKPPAVEAKPISIDDGSSQDSQPQSGKKKTRCDLCGKEFSSACVYYRHVRDVHKRLKSFKCPVCGQKFKRTTHLVRHRQRNICFPGRVPKSSNRFHECHLCKKQFAELEDLREHSKKVHCPSRTSNYSAEDQDQDESEADLDEGAVRNAYSCEIVIPSESKDKPQTLEHSLNPATGKYKCLVCSKEFKHLQHCHGHYQSVHLKIRFKCKLCSKEYTRNNLYNHHYQSVHMETTFTCQKCNRTFLLESGLKEHQREKGCCLEEPSTSEKAVGLICRHCGKGFPTSDDWREHLSLVHLLEDGCDKCGKGFLSPGLLKEHLDKVHSKPEDFICDMCGKVLRGERNLKRHRLRHLKLKSKAKRVQVELKRECQRCGKIFPNSSSLKQHVKGVHLKIKAVKPCVCEQCGKVLCSAISLKLHIKAVHLQVRDQECDLCGKSFKHRKTLIYHRRTVHAEKNRAS